MDKEIHAWILRQHPRGDQKVVRTDLQHLLHGRAFLHNLGATQLSIIGDADIEVWPRCQHQSVALVRVAAPQRHVLSDALVDWGQHAFGALYQFFIGLQGLLQHVRTDVGDAALKEAIVPLSITDVCQVLMHIIGTDADAISVLGVHQDGGSMHSKITSDAYLDQQFQELLHLGWGLRGQALDCQNIELMWQLQAHLGESH